MEMEFARLRISEEPQEMDLDVEPNPMECLLRQKLEERSVANFDTWLKKQPTRQLRRLLPDTRVVDASTRPMTSYPHLFAVVQFLLEQETGADVEEHFNSIFKTYLAAGCDINCVWDKFPPSTRSRKGFTPLLLAIDLRKVLVAKVLVELGANVNIGDRAGYLPIHWAAASSSLELMKCLLDAGAKIGPNDYGVNPPPVLHVAVDEGRVEIVDYLLGLGIDVNTSAVYSVLQEGEWDKLESRYDCGNLGNFREFLSITALGRAVRMRKLPVLSLLLRHPETFASLSDLHYCIVEGDVETANMIIEKLDPKLLVDDKIFGTQIWSLHLLGKKAYDCEQADETIKLVQTYKSYGFDMNAVSFDPSHHKNLSKRIGSEKLNLLLLATRITPRNFKLTKALVDLGADPFIALDESPSVYRNAIDSGDLDIVKIFVDSRLNVENRLKCFDDVLSMRPWNFGLKSKTTQLEMVESLYGLQNFFPRTQSIRDNLYHALKGWNELVVLFILRNTPQDDEELFRDDNQIPMGPLEEFLYCRVFQCVGTEKHVWIDSEAIVQIISGFMTLGYQLRETELYLPLVTAVTEVSFNSRFISYPQSRNLFDGLSQLSRINWSPPNESSRSPMQVAVRQLAYCTMFRNPHRAGHALPLWNGDCDSADHSYRYPGRSLCSELDKQIRGLEILEILLNKGVSAKGILVNNLLTTHKCLIRYLPLIKKLWWAGGRVNFDSLSILYDDETLLRLGIGGQQFVDDFRNWVGEAGKKDDLSLQRLVGIQIRNSLKYHDIEELTESCRVMPPKVVKELVLTPQTLWRNAK